MNSPDRQGRPMPNRRQFLESAISAVALTLLPACSSERNSQLATATKGPEPVFAPPPTIGTLSPDLGSTARPTEVSKPTASTVAQASVVLEAKPAPPTEAPRVTVKPTEAPPTTTPTLAAPETYIKVDKRRLIEVGDSGSTDYYALGFDRYDLANIPKTSCGTTFSKDDLDKRFKQEAAMGLSVVRFDLTEYMTLGGTDFSGALQVIHQLPPEMKVLITLGKHGPDCNGVSENRTDAYYAEEYKKSFPNYLEKAVGEIGNSRVAGWEIARGIQANNPDIVKAYLETTSKIIYEADPHKRPILSGVKDARQFGKDWFERMSAYQYLTAIGVDFAPRENRTDLMRLMTPKVEEVARIAEDIGKPLLVPYMERSVGDPAKDFITKDERASIFKPTVNVLVSAGMRILVVHESADLRGSDGKHSVLDNDPLRPAMSESTSLLRNR